VILFYSGKVEIILLAYSIKHVGLNIPLPEKLVLQSPGLQVSPSKEQKDEMNLIKFVPEAKAVRLEYFAALR